MSPAVSVDGLFETHLTVADIGRSVAFYTEVVGLTIAADVPDRDAAFLWIGSPGEAMLGPWSIGSAPIGLNLHVAFRTTPAEVRLACERLRALGVTPLDFFGDETDEPSVIGWMPAIAVYFRDPDGHLLEFLAMLEQPPLPDLGVVPWSHWLPQSREP
jgi:lactoylglutathione lyase